MFDLHRQLTRLVIALALLVSGACPLYGAGWRSLAGHVPKIVSSLTPSGRLPATNELHLAFGLSLRNADDLNRLLEEIYNPASPNFHHYSS